MKKELTNIVLMWENKDGSRHWDAISKNQLKGFFEKLDKDKNVNYKSMMVSSNPILFHWVEPQYHSKGLSDVYFANINDEIAGLKEPYVPNKDIKREKSNYSRDIKSEKPKEQTKFGWIAPDGRYFHCEYYEHAALAEKIVGKFNKTDNPELFLEENGWLRIIKSVYATNKNDIYDITMGDNKVLTDDQFKVLDKMELINCHNFKYYNKFEQDFY